MFLIFFTETVRSSACWTLLTSISLFLNEISSIFLFSLILIAKMSATKRYKSAEIGHSCLIPLPILQIFEIHPLFITLNIGLLYSICIHVIKISPTLNFLSVLNKKFYSTESNAFSKSINSNIPFSLNSSQLSKMSKISLVLYPILKQKSLATQNLFGILFMIKIPVLKMDKKLIAQFCLHVNYPIIVMLDWLYTLLYRSTCVINGYPYYMDWESSRLLRCVYKVTRKQTST